MDDQNPSTGNNTGNPATEISTLKYPPAFVGLVNRFLSGDTTAIQRELAETERAILAGQPTPRIAAAEAQTGAWETMSIHQLNPGFLSHAAMPIAPDPAIFHNLADTSISLEENGATIDQDFVDSLQESLLDTGNPIIDFGIRDTDFDERELMSGLGVAVSPNQDLTGRVSNTDMRALSEPLSEEEEQLIRERIQQQFNGSPHISMAQQAYEEAYQFVISQRQRGPERTGSTVPQQSATSHADTDMSTSSEPPNEQPQGWFIAQPANSPPLPMILDPVGLTITTSTLNNEPNIPSSDVNSQFRETMDALLAATPGLTVHVNPSSPPQDPGYSIPHSVVLERLSTVAARRSEYQSTMAVGRQALPVKSKYNFEEVAASLFQEPRLIAGLFDKMQSDLSQQVKQKPGETKDVSQHHAIDYVRSIADKSKNQKIREFAEACEKGKADVVEDLLNDQEISTPLKDGLKDHLLAQIPIVEAQIPKDLETAKTEHTIAQQKFEEAEKKYKEAKPKDNTNIDNDALKNDVESKRVSTILKQQAVEQKEFSVQGIAPLAYVAARGTAKLLRTDDPHKKYVLPLNEPEKTTGDMVEIVHGYLFSPKKRERLLANAEEAKTGCVDNLDDGLDKLRGLCDAISAESIGNPVELLDYLREEHGRDTAAKITAVENAGFRNYSESVETSRGATAIVSIALDLPNTSKKLSHLGLAGQDGDKPRSFIGWLRIAEFTQKDGVGDLKTAAPYITELENRINEARKNLKLAPDVKTRFQPFDEYVAEHPLFRAHMQEHYTGRTNLRVAPETQKK
ncbi:MAG: hypothetical protein V4568_03085 [Pseudomonadota bacterium]